MLEHIFARIIGFSILLAVYRISVFAIALSSIGGSLALAVIVLFTSKKYNHYQYIDQIKDISSLVLMSALMFVLTFIVGRFLTGSKIVALFIQIVVGIVSYLFLSLLFKPDGFLYLIGSMKMILNKSKRGKEG